MHMFSVGLKPVEWLANLLVTVVAHSGHQMHGNL